MALWSPVGDKGGLVPTTWVSLLMAETVEAPARMPAHNHASMPSCCGREGIDGSGVSCHPEAIVEMPHLRIIPTVEIRKKYTYTINRTSGTIFIAFFHANNTMVTPPPNQRRGSHQIPASPTH
jgi:hypothetical protein